MSDQSSSSSSTPLPTLDSISDAAIRERLRELASNARIIKDLITDLEENDYKDAMDKLKKFVRLHHLESIRGEDTNGEPLTIYRKRGSRSSINEQKLVEHGVPVNTIEECTDIVTYESIEVQRPRGWRQNRKENENA